MINTLIQRYPALAVCQNTIVQAAQAMIQCYEGGNKILTCGNGGSCADADHIVGELMKGFLKKRPLTEYQKHQMHNRNPQLDPVITERLQQGLPALSLCSLTALNTAFCNDVDPVLLYAQGLIGLGKEGDVLICLSTSGNAKNVCAAAQAARALGIFVVALTGANGGMLKDIADLCICVPETETFQVQELHLPVYHYLCAATETHFFPT